MIFLFDKDLIRAFENGGKNADTTWTYFLNKYSKLILKVIRSYTNDYDEVMDKYLFVCKKLSENNFSILKKYNYKDKRKAKLSTWLTVVVRNLCVDQFRDSHGRKRLPAVFKNMDGTERKIFKHYFYDGLDAAQISTLLQPGKSLDEIGDLIDRLKKSFQSQNNNYFKKNYTVELNENISSSEPLSNELIEMDEMSNILNQLIKSTDSVEQYILTLRFWDGLTIKQISHLTFIPTRRVNYILEKVLNSFRTKIKKEHFR